MAEIVVFSTELFNQVIDECFVDLDCIQEPKGSRFVGSRIFVVNDGELREEQKVSSTQDAGNGKIQAFMSLGSLFSCPNTKSYSKTWRCKASAKS